MTCCPISDVIFGDLYSPAVLVGNWFENRFTGKTDKRAITPGIYGSSGCIDGISTYRHDFHPDIIGPKHQLIHDYLLWKQDAHHNRVVDEESNIKFSDGRQFEKNMTTMSDVMYRIKSKEPIPTTADDILKKKPKVDLMMSYGNATTSGLRKYKWCEAWKERRTPVDRSHYQAEFVPKQLVGPVVRFPRAPRAVFN